MDSLSKNLGTCSSDLQWCGQISYLVMGESLLYSPGRGIQLSCGLEKDEQSVFWMRVLVEKYAF